MNFKIKIRNDGMIEFLGDTCPLDLPLENPVRRRASTIRPVRFIKRMAFRILRTVCGDTGRAAAFTRTWGGPWRVVILATSQTYTAPTRAECVAWEIEQLQ